MSKPYFTLCIREDGVWTPQWGSYNRKEAQQQFIDAWPDTKQKDATIIKSDDRQASINTSVETLNRVRGP